MLLERFLALPQIEVAEKLKKTITFFAKNQRFAHFLHFVYRE